MWLEQLTSNTRRAYRTNVLEFAQFAGTSPEKLSSLPHMELFNKARAFVKSIEGQSSATVARKMSAIRSYINFLCNIGILKANPLDFIKVGKVHNAEKEFLSDEDVQKIISVIKVDTLVGMRNLLIVQMVTELGLRRAEIAKMTYGNLREDAAGRKVLKFVGKREKERSLPVSQELLANLAKYREMAGVTVLSDDIPLTPNSSGEVLCGQYIYEMVQNYADAAGVCKKVTPHSFRHYAITDAAKVEDNMLALMEFSGHASVATLKRYTHFQDTEKVQQIQDKRAAKCSPVNFQTT